MPLVPPYIAALRAYQPGRSIEEVKKTYGLARVAKLGSNENFIGPSPRAVEAVAGCLHGLNYYPNAGLDLREKLAEKFNVKVSNVIPGTGSDGVMAVIMRTFLCDDDEVLTTEGAFIGFQVLAHARGVAYRTVPLKNWGYDLPAIAGAITEKTKIVYLANPNNPTGTMFTRAEFEDFYPRVPKNVLIIMDEAYYEYARQNPDYPDSMDYRYDNVITLRTFSKAYGLAGLRVGYGFAHEELIANLLKVKLTFEPSLPGQVGGVAAIDDVEFVEQTVKANARARDVITRGMRDMGMDVIPSEANFVMVPLDTAERAKWLTEELLHRGVIVRPLAAFGLPRCVRISTGSDEDNRMLLDALEQLQMKEVLCRK